MLSKIQVDFLNDCVLCWLATVYQDGTPNVSPKEIFTCFGNEYIIMANIASPKSVRNFRRNGLACISAIDPFVQKGYKLKCKGQIMTPSHNEFHKAAEILNEMAGDKFPVGSIMLFNIKEVEEILAPSYRFYPETKEADIVTSAMNQYGVQPLNPNK